MTEIYQWHDLDFRSGFISGLYLKVFENQVGRGDCTEDDVATDNNNDVFDSTKQ